jgi:hypothetical protein
MLATDIKRDDRGVDRCNRRIMTAVPNVLGDDSKGYHNVESFCGMPIVQRISDGVKGCPRCDKEPAVGNVHPRTTNAAGVKLTPAELKECGLTEDLSSVIIKEIDKKVIDLLPAVEATMSEIKKDVVSLDIKLEEIEASNDVVRLLVQRVVDNMDSLPTPTLKESKRLIKLQERLVKLLEA